LIVAIEKEACTKIELHCLETATQILAHGLTSAAAREFLAALPAITELMPPLDVQQVETMLEARQFEDDGGRRYRYRPDLMPAPREDEDDL
jgi:hypothetical protein